MPNRSPRVTVSKLLLAFYISLGSNTENPGSKHHSCFHIFICSFFSDLENVDGKNYTKLPGCNRVHSHQCFECAPACMCLYGDFQKPQYSSYKLVAEFHLRAGNLFPRHAGIMLPVTYLFSSAEVSVPSCLSCWLEEQPVMSREGSCLAGAMGSGPREEINTGIFWCRLLLNLCLIWVFYILLWENFYQLIHSGIK